MRRWIGEDAGQGSAKVTQCCWVYVHDVYVGRSLTSPLSPALPNFGNVDVTIISLNSDNTNGSLLNMAFVESTIIALTYVTNAFASYVWLSELPVNSNI